MNKSAAHPHPHSCGGAVVVAQYSSDASHSPTDRAERIVREPECHQRTGLSRSTRWRLERAGLFPRRRRLSLSCSGWLESELAAWMAAR